MESKKENVYESRKEKEGILEIKLIKKETRRNQGRKVKEPRKEHEGIKNPIKHRKISRKKLIGIQERKMYQVRNKNESRKEKKETIKERIWRNVNKSRMEHEWIKEGKWMNQGRNTKENEKIQERFLGKENVSSKN